MLSYPYFWQKKSSIISIVLIPLSYLFRLLGALRNKLCTAKKLNGFVICVGNATAGGTGKTQVIKYLANYCRNKNLNFIIISKGFGSCLKEAKLVEAEDLAIDVGDEAVELTKVGSVISSKKIEDAIPILDIYFKQSFSSKKFSSDKMVILVDDGMQNPKFIKDLTILTIDSSRGFGNQRIIPAGPLREPVREALRRSDVIISIGNSSNNFDLSEYDINPETLILKANINLNLQQNPDKPENFIDKKKNFIAFCGIGNPDRFFSILEKNDIKLVERICFPDHHNYSEGDIKNLLKIAEENDSLLITTNKDHVKLKNILNESELSIIKMVEANIVFPLNEGKFIQLLDKKINDK